MNPFTLLDCYCINLKDRPDRRAEASREFEQQDIKVEFVDGVIYTNFKDKRRNACTGNHLAHAKCIERAKEKGSKYCLIFEDDVEFFKDRDTTHEVLSSAIEDLPEDFALLYLGINMDKFRAYRYAKNLAKIDGGFSTHAYIINSIVYDLLISINSDTTVIHNDVTYAERIHPFYKSFVTNPLLAGQRESYSDIMRTVMNSNEMFKQRFINNLV